MKNYRQILLITNLHREKGVGGREGERGRNRKGKNISNKVQMPRNFIVNFEKAQACQGQTELHTFKSFISIVPFSGHEDGGRESSIIAGASPGIWLY